METLEQHNIKNIIFKKINDYNILSLDGGGIRGLILLQQLVVLEQKLGKPLCEVFNLISGTSTGGIIAVLLSLGYTAEELLNFYIVHGEKIFNKKWYRLGIFRPKYDDEYFNFIIKEYIKDLTLKDVKCDVLIVGYNVSTMDKIIFKSRKAKVDDKYNYSLFDVIRSTAAAPSFFKPHKIADQLYVDGGLVINNPSLVSYIEAINYDIKYNKINLISFSTGTKEKPLSKKIIKGGLIRWVSPTVDILLTEQAQTTDYFLNSIFLKEKGNYLRCNSFIDKSSGKIDDVSKKNIENMIADGQTSAEKNNHNISNFCKFVI